MSLIEMKQIFLIKDSYKPNYKLLINKCQQAVETHFRDSKTSIKYLSSIRNFYKKMMITIQGKNAKY